jgi:hypothetical protein
MNLVLSITNYYNNSSMKYLLIFLNLFLDYAAIILIYFKQVSKIRNFNIGFRYHSFIL